MGVLDALVRLVQDAGALHGRLILVTGGDARARSALLTQAAEEGHGLLLQLGVELSSRLVPVPRGQRPLQAARLLRDAVNAACASKATALLDCIEVLFDHTLRLDPLDALRRIAHDRTVVVNWPGETRGGRLTYAPAQHPEHRDYPVAGLITFQLH